MKDEGSWGDLAVDEVPDRNAPESLPPAHFELDPAPRSEPIAVPRTGRELEQVDPVDLELDLSRLPTEPHAPPYVGAELDAGPDVTSSALDTPLERPPRPPRRHEIGVVVHGTRGPSPGFWRRVPIAPVVPFLGWGGVPWLLYLGALAFIVTVSSFWVVLLTSAVCYGSFLVHFGQALRIGLNDQGGSLPSGRWHLPTGDDVLEVLPGGAILIFVTGGLGYLLVREVGFSPAHLPFWIAGSVVMNVYFLVAWTRICFGGGVLAGLDVVGTIQSMIAGGLPFLFVGVLYSVLGTLVGVAAALFAFGLAFAAPTWAAHLLLPLAAIGSAWASATCGYLMGRVLDERDAFATNPS